MRRREAGRAREPRRTATQRDRWLALRVVLHSKADEEFDPPPGRDLLASRRHTFAQLASAIDRAFARWDRGHSHLFRLSDGRRVGEPSDEWVMPNWAGDLDLEPGDLDESQHTLGSVGLGAGDTFEYVFDLAHGWLHACDVLRDDVDPREEYGETTKEIVPVWGWGSIPDQYGRVTPDDEAEDGEDA